MYQKLTIIGRLGKDPETRVTQAGDKVTQFSVAVSEWSTTKKEERTQWFDCIYWGDGGVRLSERMHKGDRIFVEGAIRSRKYTPRDSDTERVVWEVHVFAIRMIDYVKPDAEQDAGGNASARRKDDERKRDERDDGWDDNRAASPKKAAPSRRNDVNDLSDDIPF